MSSRRLLVDSKISLVLGSVWWVALFVSLAWWFIAVLVKDGGSSGGGQSSVVCAT